MLKKLAKYGNSTTLVIDKAILELLNMNESSIVKLHTDGKSLIITPVEQDTNEKKISYDNLEALATAKESFEKKMDYKGYEHLDENAKIKVQELKPVFDQIFQKHKIALQKFNLEVLPSTEFQNELGLLTERIDPLIQPEEYYKEFNLIKLRFCPELADFQKEMEEVGKKCTSGS